VSLARIHGSNKAYIEHTIPHISGLMKTSLESTLEDSEVVVVAKRSPEFEETLNRVNGSHVIDLVSILAEPDGQKGGYEGICW
jgi:hypothetical protein